LDQTDTQSFLSKEKGAFPRVTFAVFNRELNTYSILSDLLIQTLVRSIFEKLNQAFEEGRSLPENYGTCLIDDSLIAQRLAIRQVVYDKDNMGETVFSFGGHGESCFKFLEVMTVFVNSKGCETIDEYTKRYYTFLHDIYSNNNEAGSRTCLIS